MKTKLFKTLLLIAALLSISAYSQTTSIQKTTLIKERNGQKFFVHTVKKGETLYAIAKTYNCSPSDIEKQNPSLKGSVNDGMELYILQNNAASTSGQNYKQHTVTKGQSMYAICKLYSIELQELIAANPELKKGVETGQVLQIPVKETPSTNKQNTNGTTHTVEKGQTIYSISKQYNITPDELKIANPSLVDGLKLGSQLIIPTKNAGTPTVQTAAIQTNTTNATTVQTTTANNQNSGIHAVAKGETAFSIAKRYGTTVDELNTLNPGLKDGLKVGMVLQIPVKQKETTLAVLNKPTNNHTIVAGETLFSIAQHYEATTADIIALNPELKDGKFTIGSVIKVPATATTAQTTSTPSKATVSESPKLCCDSTCSTQKQLSIALCLPLYVKANDTIDLTGETMVKKEERLFPKSVPYIEFYEGVLMGLDSLKRLGISVTLSVFDTQSDTTHGAAIVNKLSAQNNDLIICIDDEAFETIAHFAQNKQIPIIHPLSTNTQYALNNPYCYVINTPQPYRIEQMSLYTSRIADANVLVVNNNHLQELDFTEMYRSILGSDSTRFHAVTYTKKGIKGIESVLSGSQKNIVIIPSEDQAFVNDVVTRLYQYAKRFDIELQGLAVWETYKNIELDYLFDMHFTFATSNNRNYTDSSVHRFVLNYRSNFHTEPGRLSFLGYDVLLYLGQAMHRYGTSFNSCCNRFEWSGLQTHFCLQRISERGGYVNSGTYIIRYNSDDFTRSEQNFDVKQARTDYLLKQNKPNSTVPLIKPLSTESPTESE